jgi:hypothetical protein
MGRQRPSIHRPSPTSGALASLAQSSPPLNGAPASLAQSGPRRFGGARVSRSIAHAPVWGACVSRSIAHAPVWGAGVSRSMAHAPVWGARVSSAQSHPTHVKHPRLSINRARLNEGRAPVCLLRVPLMDKGCAPQSHPPVALLPACTSHVLRSAPHREAPQRLGLTAMSLPLHGHTPHAHARRPCFQ